MNWGALVTATLGLYQQAVQDTWRKIPRYWWVGFLPLLYAPVFFFIAGLVAPLDLIGGFILGFVLAVCTSSYLYFLSEVVAGRRTSLRDLGESWRPFFWSVITILFFLTLVQYTLAFFLPPVASAQAFRLLINLVLLIILNPVPEIIYQGRSEGLNMLQESVEFLRDSGVEWFLPLIVLALFSFLLFPLPVLMMPLETGRLTFPAVGGGQGLFLGSVAGLVWAAVNAFLLFILMVFRGLLFRALSGSTRRQRAFRARLS